MITDLPKVDENIIAAGTSYSDILALDKAEGTNVEATLRVTAFTGADTVLTVTPQYSYDKVTWFDCASPSVFAAVSIATSLPHFETINLNFTGIYVRFKYVVAGATPSVQFNVFARASSTGGGSSAAAPSGNGSSSSSSSAGGGGASTYSNAQGDFVATANAGAKTITFSAYANAVLSAVISNTNFLTATIKRRTFAGVVDSLPVTNVSFVANVLTLSDMSANFAAGDTVEVVIVGPDKAFVAAVNATLTKSYDAPHYEYQDPTYGFAGTQDKLPAGDILGEILVRQQSLTNAFKVKDSGGRIKLGYGHIDPALGNGTYYVRAIDSATLPGDGPVTDICDPQILNHTNTVGRPWQLDLRGASFKFNAGCWIVLSSTYPLLTKAGNYMSGCASAA